MKLDASSLRLIWQECVNGKNPDDGQKVSQLHHQRFRSDETTTVNSLMKQLARLQLQDDKDIHQFFIRAQELLNRLHHAGEELSETLFRAMVLNGLLQRYEHFVVQESFNLAEKFVELRRRLSKFKGTAADREMMWRRITILPCQQRSLPIKLVYTFHSNHMLGILFLSFVVLKTEIAFCM